MTQVFAEAERLLEVLGIEVKQEDPAYGAAVAEFITDYCRGHSDPAHWDEDLHLVARHSENLFRRGYRARQAQERKMPDGLRNGLRSALLDAARGFELLADNSGATANSAWLAECRQKAVALTSYAEALDSFAETSSPSASEALN